MNICLNCKVSSETQHNCDDIINEDPEIICQCFCNEDSLAEDDVEIIINMFLKNDRVGNILKKLIDEKQN